MGRGGISFALVVENGECLLAGATGPWQGQTLHHGEAQRGIHMDGTSPWDPASAQPVCLAPWPLHVAHFIGTDAVLFLIQAAQLLPLYRERDGQTGTLTRVVGVAI